MNNYKGVYFVLLNVLLCFGLTFSEAQAQAIFDPMKKQTQVSQPFYAHKEPGLSMVICPAAGGDKHHCRALIGEHWVHVNQLFDGHKVKSITKNRVVLTDPLGPEIKLYLSSDVKITASHIYD